jgi:hypothetical protein
MHPHPASPRHHPHIDVESSWRPVDPGLGRDRDSRPESHLSGQADADPRKDCPPAIAMALRRIAATDRRKPELEGEAVVEDGTLRMTGVDARRLSARWPRLTLFSLERAFNKGIRPLPLATGKVSRHAIQRYRQRTSRCSASVALHRISGARSRDPALRETSASGCARLLRPRSAWRLRAS